MGKEVNRMKHISLKLQKLEERIAPGGSLNHGDPGEARGKSQTSNVRTIFSSDWERSGDEFIYTVRGSGFLHHMVRNLVGTFLLVGKGTLNGEDFCAILSARDRSSAGATAPAGGLYLLVSSTNSLLLAARFRLF